MCFVCFIKVYLISIYLYRYFLFRMYSIYRAHIFLCISNRISHLFLLLLCIFRVDSVLIAYLLLFCLKRARATLPALRFLEVFLIIFCWFWLLFLVLCWFFGAFSRFSTRRCFGLFSMFLGCLFLVGLRFSVGWCKFISCCSARLVLLGWGWWAGWCGGGLRTQERVCTTY